MSPFCPACGDPDTECLVDLARDGLGRVWEEWICNTCSEPFERNSRKEDE